MDSVDEGKVRRDQEALDKYQESKKRPRSNGNSPSDEDSLLASPSVKKEKTDSHSSEPFTSVWQNDPSGLYGLKSDYLRVLGIEPPICSWICVENFRCDKSELREILELAGYVVVCSLVHNNQKHAKIMYSHPLEAVQAVSMFNKQTFYGSTLKVTMMKLTGDSVILPKGLLNIGPGFGSFGKPLRDVVKHYERLVKQEPHSINALLFHDPSHPRDDSEIKPTGSEEIVESSKSEEDINEKYQLSKKFIIRNVNDDDSDDSKSDTGSKSNCSTVTKELQYLPEYSPSGPISPVWNDKKCGNVSQLNEVPKKSSPNNLGPMENNVTNNTHEAILDPRAGPVATGPVPEPIYPNKGVMPTPVGMQGPNGPAPIGSRFGTNVTMGGPMSGFGPNGPNGPGFGPNNPIGNGFRPNAPMIGHSSGMGPNAAIPLPIGHGIRPNAGPTSAMLPVPAHSNYCTVQFRNLPPSTTFPIICEKMAECGQVMSIQLTTPGCATVVYLHPAHAQRCLQRFNNIRVEGCVIEARVI